MWSWNKKKKKNPFFLFRSYNKTCNSGPDNSAMTLIICPSPGCPLAKIFLLPNTYIYKAISQSGGHSRLIVVFRALLLSTRKRNIFSSGPSFRGSLSFQSFHFVAHQDWTIQSSPLLSQLPPFPSYLNNFFFPFLFFTSHPHLLLSRIIWITFFLLKKLLEMVGGI